MSTPRRGDRGTGEAVTYPKWKAVLRAMTPGETRSLTYIADRIGSTPKTVKLVLAKLQNGGGVREVENRWALTPVGELGRRGVVRVSSPIAVENCGACPFQDNDSSNYGASCRIEGDVMPIADCRDRGIPLLCPLWVAPVTVELKKP